MTSSNSEVDSDVNTLSTDETINFDNEIATDFEDFNGDEILEKILSKKENFIEESENKNENETYFKVIGNTDVSLTCKPKIVEASWVRGSTTFPSNIKYKTSLKELNFISDISSDLIDVLSKHTDVLFPVQQATIPQIIAASQQNVLAPRDFVISAPTGSGKTLCFVLPILNALRNVNSDASFVYALVIAPVQVLALQIYKEFIKYNIFKAKIVLLNGSTEYECERNTLFDFNNYDGTSQAHIIVATPGRLVEHLVDSKGTINLSNLRFLVVDEADRMIDTARIEWLELVEQRSQISSTNNITIADLTNINNNRYLQKILCSATLSLDFNDLYLWNLRYPKLFTANENESKENNINQNFDSNNIINKFEKIILPKNLTQKVALCLPNMKPVILYWLIASNIKKWKKVLIFVNQTSISNRLTFLLSEMAKQKFKVKEFSSNLYGSRLKKCIKKFEEEKFQVMVASDVLSRGIDVKNIDCVVNYNTPINERIFVHRAGRTARGTAEGTVLSIVDKDEKMKLKKLLCNIHVWSDNILTDYRETEKFINTSLLEKYGKALNHLKQKFNKK